MFMAYAYSTATYLDLELPTTHYHDVYDLFLVFSRLYECNMSEKFTL